MSSRPKYNIGEEEEEASVRWTEFARIHSNYSSGTSMEEFRMGCKGWEEKEGKKKTKKGDDEANTLHDVLYVGGLSLVWIDKSILWKSDRRTDFYAWMTAVSIFNVDHFSLECRFIVSSTCLLCMLEPFATCTRIFFYFSHPRKLGDGYDRIPQLRDFLNAVSKDILFSFSFFFLE